MEMKGAPGVSLKGLSSLPYVTPGLPGVGGRLKERPDHFVVEETPAYEPNGEGPHLFVNLTKEGLTTREVQRGLAALFDLPVGAVSFAGLKDKHARATQTFSLFVGEVHPDFPSHALELINARLPVNAHWARPHRRKIKAGHLRGNRFRVTISGVELGMDEAIERARRIADRLREKGAPNYYGPQRIGVAGENATRGLEIIRGGLSVGNRWLRRFLVSSYLDHLCNRYLARRVERGAFERILEGDVAKKHSTGGMFLVEDAEREQPRYLTQEISFTAPIFGPKMWETRGQARELEGDILGDEGVTLERLGELGVRGTRRLGRILPDLSVEVSEEGLVLRFTLPKGAYATTVLREVMKTPDY